MKTLNLCFLFVFLCFTMDISAQNKKSQQDDLDDDIYYEVEDFQDITWKQKGFEIFISGGIYFGGKYTASYYNGAPDNDINLRMLLKNEHYRRQIIEILRNNYRFIDTAVLMEDYSLNSKYNIAMDIGLGFRYRVHKNWYLEASYSFRRLTCQNDFVFEFKGETIDMFRRYSNRQSLLAKEDRHYIDLSVGYISHKHPIVKPFISMGAMFTYINLNNMWFFIESDLPTFDMKEIAKYPNYIPGYQEMPNYRVWAGAGYGFSLTAGLKFAVNKSVSIDPMFQLSICSFGNSSMNLPGYNTSLGCNYLGAIRIVMSDKVFVKSVKENPTPAEFQQMTPRQQRRCKGGVCPAP